MPRPVEPRLLAQRSARTVFLRVPSSAWTLISAGTIHEFRAASGNASQLWHVPLPTFAVCYRRRRDTFDYRVMVLTDVRQEALGTVTDEGLRRAGYDGEGAFARFRRDWMIAEKRRFEPLRKVHVYSVRPIEPGDHEEVGVALVHHLYNEALRHEAGDRPRSVQLRQAVAA